MMQRMDKGYTYRRRIAITLKGSIFYYLFVVDGGDLSVDLISDGHIGQIESTLPAAYENCMPGTNLEVQDAIESLACEWDVNIKVDLAEELIAILGII